MNRTPSTWHVEIRPRDGGDGVFRLSQKNTSASHLRRSVLRPSLAVILLLAAGCADRVRQPSSQELAQFAAADSDGPAVDMSRIAQARLPVGPYRVVAGDVLQVQMPRILDGQNAAGLAASDGYQDYSCRVGDDGTVILPIVGRFVVAGRSLAEIESAAVAEYFPKYLKTLLPIHVSVAEYGVRRVSIVGAVGTPGIYALRHDQMSLTALLMASGGISDTGAAIIRIARRASEGSESAGGQTPGEESRDSSLQASGLSEKTALAKGPAASSDRRSEIRGAIFAREGSSDAGGWLSLYRGERIVVHRYLDMANEGQRLDLVKRAAGEFGPEGAEEIYAGLEKLAEYLAPASSAAVRQPKRIHDLWEATDDGRFVMFLGVSSQETAARDMQPATGRSERDARSGGVMTVVLPVRGMNVPFADVTLEEGDSVVVERPVEQFVSVVGLVARPGNMPYPSDARYNLIQAIAFAGGLDAVADPRYVSIYRLRADGSINAVTLQLMNPKNEQQLTEILALPLRPGDVVSVEHTPRTRTNVFLERYFNLSLGLYLRPEEIWADD